MIKITIEKNGAVNPLRFVLGNQYENNDETLAFDFPVELNECYKYLIATHKETGKTIVLPINEAQISVSSALTWLAGEWLMQVLFKGTELDLEATELDLKDDVVSISNQFYGFVKKASFKAENLKEAPTDENIKVYYESMKQSIIDEVVAQVGTGGGSGSVSDVLVNGTTTVDENGNAIIPIASSSKLGVVMASSTYGLQSVGGSLAPLNWATYAPSRTNAFMTYSQLDNSIKVGMCDGKGSEWSATEKANARARMGIDTWEEVAYVEVEEDGEQLSVAFENGYRKLYVYLSQENCEVKKTGTVYLYPNLVDEANATKLRAYTSLKANYEDICLMCENHNNLWIERNVFACNSQKNTTVYAPSFKINDKKNDEKLSSYNDLNFYGLTCNFATKGMRVVVLGVRA